MATKYVVLRMQNTGGGGDDAGLWDEGLTVEARSAQSAIQSAMLNETEGGTFVAVPARSWKPVTVKVETKTALKFS